MSGKYFDRRFTELRNVVFMAAFMGATLNAAANADADNGRALRPLPLEVTANYRHIEEFSLSPDGESFVLSTAHYAWHRGSADEVDTRMTIHRLNGGEDISIQPPKDTPGEMSTPAWSPNGRYVAYYLTQGSKTFLAVWDTARGESVRPSNIQLIPGEEVTSYSSPVWSPDSRFILLRAWASPPGAEQKFDLPYSLARYDFAFPEVSKGTPSLLVFKSENRQAKTSSEDKMPVSPRKTLVTDLMVVDVQSGQTETIARKEVIADATFSPDGRWVVYGALRPSPRGARIWPYDLIVYDRSARTQTVVGKDLPMDRYDRVCWSPDGHSLAFLTRSPGREGDPLPHDGEISILDMNTRQIRALSDTKMARFDRHRTHQTAPQWSVDGSSLYDISSEGQVWRMDVPSKRMTGIPLPSGEKAIGLLSGPSAAGTNILAITRNQNAHSSSVFQISVDNKATLLFTQPGAIATSAQASFKSGVMVYSLQSSTEPGDLWRAQLSHGSPQKMTGNGAGFDAVNLATARVVEWKGADGVARKAALLLPANYRPGEKLPLVVWSYGGEKGSDFIDTYGFWGPGNFDMQVLATRGYAVLSPDLPINIGSPMHDIFTGTMNAVDELVREGIADPDRMAIMGQSYGSYSTLSTITQTTRFKAAVISSVLVPDLMTDYLYMSPNGQGVATDGVEHGQIRMGATPWENPGRYIDNSPIWKFDRIETPLLMALGTEDGATNFDGANGTFVALQRLGKEAEYRLYQGEGHGFLQPEDVMDWWNRRIAFLDEKLGVVRDHDGMMLMPATRGNEKSK